MVDDPLVPAPATASPSGLLASFLPGDRRRELAGGRVLPGVVSGAALFADISGFTPLSEALVDELGPQRGAEELNRTLNRVYQALVDRLFAVGGEVLYYSGDAVTCWLDGDDGARAVRCALDMQDTIREVGRIETASASVALSIKVAVAVGTARRFVVGDPEIQRMDVLAGGLIDRLVAAEGAAVPGEVIVDESAIASLGDRLVAAETRRSSTGTCGVVSQLVGAVDTSRVTSPPALPADVARPWILPPVFERLIAGGSDTFLGELRTTHPIFIRFGGFDFDDDPSAPAELDRFVRAVQAAFEPYDGALLGLTVGDKGAYFNAVMGAPHAHEDDGRRAVAAALAVRDLEAETPAVGIQVGVARGRTFSGTYGHTRRRTYTVMGDPTNVAARLMSAAPAGEVYVLNEVADDVGDRYVWADLPPLRLKGKSEPVTVRRAVEARRRPPMRVIRYPLPMVGRERELTVATDCLDALRAGERRVLGIGAEAGMGKSRFVAEILRVAQSSGIGAVVGAAEALGGASYGIWREIWRVLFGLDDETSAEEQLREVERRLAAVDPRLVPRLPLLGNVLELDVPDNDFVRPFDAKLRKTSLESMLAEVLRSRLADEPLLIVLDDVQWIDPLSSDLLTRLVRATAAGAPALFVLGYRRTSAVERPPGVGELPGFREIELAELDHEAVRSVVAAKVEQVFGAGVVADEALHALVHTRAQGNPFYAEELVNYLHRLGLDPADPAAVADIDLPDSLQTMILSRIDDLDERPRQGIKVASVLGRQFAASLVGPVHGSLGDDAEVLDHLGEARRIDLVVPEEDDLADWLFRHAITRDVAYDSLPFGVRTELHERAGDVLVERVGERSPATLDVLAHHFWHGADDAKKRRYLRLAGDASRASYANAAAIEHYGRLAGVVDDAERGAVLLELAAVLEVTGDWDAAESRVAEARDLAERYDDVATAGWADVALAEITRKRGGFEAAATLLGRADDSFASADDAAGRARVRHLLGTLRAQQGDLAGARIEYEASRSIREVTGDRSGLASLLSNLGVLAEYEGDYAASTANHRRALELRREEGDRWAVAISLTNLGMIAVHESRYADSRDLFEEVMRLTVEVGDAWMIAPTHNNLGNAHRDLGDAVEAARHYAAALEIYDRYDESWGLTFLLEDIAVLIAPFEPRRALELLGAADRVRDEASTPRPESLDEELTARLAPHLTALGADEQAVARLRGAARSKRQAVEVAGACLSAATIAG